MEKDKYKYIMKFNAVFLLIFLLFGKNVTAQNINLNTKRYVTMTEIIHFGDRRSEILVTSDSALLNTFNYSQFVSPQNVLKIVLDQSSFNKLIIAINKLEIEKISSRKSHIYYILISDGETKEKNVKLEMDDKQVEWFACFIYNDCYLND